MALDMPSVHVCQPGESALVYMYMYIHVVGNVLQNCVCVCTATIMYYTSIPPTVLAFMKGLL